MHTHKADKRPPTRATATAMLGVVLVLVLLLLAARWQRNCVQCERETESAHSNCDETCDCILYYTIYIVYVELYDNRLIL